MKKTTKAKTLKSLMETKFKKQSWVVDTLIPKGITIISAQSSGFKTWLLFDLVKCITGNDDFLGYFKCKKRKVLMVDEENYAGDVKRRFEKLSIKKTQRVYFLLGKNFKVDNQKDLNRLMEIIKKKEIKVVCFDSLVRVHSKGDENNSAQIAKVFSCFKKIAKNGASVIILHHNRKGGGHQGGWQNMRGSSDIQAAVDCHLSVKHNTAKTELEIVQHKLRQAQEIPPFNVKIEEEDNIIKFVFSGKTKISKKDEDDVYKTAILKIIGKRSVPQFQIERAMKIKLEVGRNKVIRLLKELRNDKEVKCDTGVKHSKYYSIKKEAV